MPGPALVDPPLQSIMKTATKASVLANVKLMGHFGAWKSSILVPVYDKYLQDYAYMTNHTTQFANIMNSNAGPLLVRLIYELLEYLELSNTIEMFEKETNVPFEFDNPRLTLFKWKIEEFFDNFIDDEEAEDIFEPQERRFPILMKMFVYYARALDPSLKARLYPAKNVANRMHLIVKLRPETVVEDYEGSRGMENLLMEDSVIQAYD